MTSQTMLLTDTVTAVEAQARAISVMATLKETTPASEPPYSSLNETQFGQFFQVGQQGGAVFFRIQLGGHRFEFGLGKVTGRVLNQFLFFTEV
jgi:hypothetical protein